MLAITAFLATLQQIKYVIKERDGERERRERVNMKRKREKKRRNKRGREQNPLAGIGPMDWMEHGQL